MDGLLYKIYLSKCKIILIKNYKYPMPLQHIKYINSHGILGVWRLIEDESYFSPFLDGLVDDKRNLETITHESRRREWIAGRWLVKILAQYMNLSFTGIKTDSFNKPHLVAANASISISHAEPFVVAILNTTKLCGIDVEKIRQKLIPLSTKFLNDEELEAADGNLSKLAILWGAKEALYKLHGRKSLIFKTNLSIENFTYENNLGSFTGNLIIDNKTEKYVMKAGKFNDHVLVYTE